LLSESFGGVDLSLFAVTDLAGKLVLGLMAKSFVAVLEGKRIVASMPYGVSDKLWKRCRCIAGCLFDSSASMNAGAEFGGTTGLSFL